MIDRGDYNARKDKWISKAKIHNLYYPSGFKADEDYRGIANYIVSFSQVRGISLPPPVFYK